MWDTLWSVFHAHDSGIISWLCVPLTRLHLTLIRLLLTLCFCCSQFSSKESLQLLVLFAVLIPSPPSLSSAVAAWWDAWPRAGCGFTTQSGDMEWVGMEGIHSSSSTFLCSTLLQPGLEHSPSCRLRSQGMH